MGLINLPTELLHAIAYHTQLLTIADVNASLLTQTLAAAMVHDVDAGVWQDRLIDACLAHPYFHVGHSACLVLRRAATLGNVRVVAAVAGHPAADLRKCRSQAIYGAVDNGHVDVVALFPHFRGNAFHPFPVHLIARAISKGIAPMVHKLTSMASRHQLDSVRLVVKSSLLGAPRMAFVQGAIDIAPDAIRAVFEHVPTATIDAALPMLCLPALLQADAAAIMARVAPHHAAVFAAATSGNLPALRCALDNASEVTCPDLLDTALSLAMACGHVEAMDMIADVLPMPLLNIIPQALLIAVGRSHLRTIERLADIARPVFTTSVTASLFQAAVALGYIECVDFLIQRMDAWHPNRCYSHGTLVAAAIRSGSVATFERVSNLPDFNTTAVMRAGRDMFSILVRTDGYDMLNAIADFAARNASLAEHTNFFFFSMTVAMSFADCVDRGHAPDLAAVLSRAAIPRTVFTRLLASLFITDVQAAAIHAVLALYDANKPNLDAPPGASSPPGASTSTTSRPIQKSRKRNKRKRGQAQDSPEVTQW
ncbi:uncharacterized protein AMSG_08594 [Thecamonas trahens ATCC 50062]|uniref:Ankyrin repeat protein n=1 Tax=Thecamonas trahens ATCC 50062 TaxID=461836 RepID=A0A0L0DJY5_THETB|nr:hypothetical protein AMSG_08594 [Thecamonas trahens ATCC 50062]KNC52714.1 hypothetical protein AMSG_08594 [Thecamonas trahens ATCC 50062]|eukprot:XP_013755031.1 hypothetical protein AMSG_08594 [Thecamonas trahens ATCC 50062]